MDRKQKLLSTALSLALLMPSSAFGATMGSNHHNGVQDIGSSRPIASKASTLEEYRSDQPPLPAEIQEKVEELKGRYKNGEITKEQFRQELKKIIPEEHQRNHRKKGGKHKLSDEAKTELEALKAKLKKGEITKEEFKQKLKELIPQDTELEDQ